MSAVERIGGRFLVEAEVASGGMGRVLRARDTETNEVVAVKMMIRADPASVARFERECRALAGVGHPGIVRYISHGMLPDGAPYLVMQWLSGRDLAHLLRDHRDPQTRVSAGRRARGAPRGLSIRDVVTLGVRVASALGALHRAGIVHRDVKPSNVFLPDGTVDNAKVVDLGTVRSSGAMRDLTQTGAVVGTPFYMAPEQARGDSDVGPAADVFALACVLYECLTGNCPFYASHFVAVLGRILLDEPDPIIKSRPDAPPELVALIEKMLRKEAADRPPDGEAVAAVLAGIRDALSSTDAATPTPSSGEMSAERSALTPTGSHSSIGSDERRLSCFLWARARGAIDVALVHEHGGIATDLGDGAMLVGIANVASASDQAVRTARLALAIQRAHPDVAVSIATGQVDAQAGRAPTGSDVARRAQAALVGTPSGTIAIDAVTSALIAGNFVIARTPAGQVLVSGDVDSHGTRTAGKLVGRKREMSVLTANLEEALDESVARGVVVIAGPGLGKTRIGQELERVLAERDDVARVFRAQADVAGAGSTYALIGSALRHAARLRPRDDAAKVTERTSALVARVPPERRARTLAFVRELCGVAADDDDDALRAARGDPALFGAQVRAAWEELLRAESSRGAVVLVLDNLQWADAPSIRLVTAALGALGDRPFFVLALGRPEARAAHPDLLARRGITELALEPLTPRACTTYAQDALGDDAAPELIATIVERSGGNPFYLEELVRAAQAGTGEKLPESILGMAQARLSGLSPEARRVLRAASVLGEVLWAGAVEHLLGAGGMTFGTSEWLDDLVRKELLVARTESRYPGQRELAFRHSIVREAAYAMLTPEDRERAHRAAAMWLEEVGERDPLVLALHLRQGGQRETAAQALRRAAEQALERNDHAGAVARAREAVEAGADGETRGACLAIVAACAAWAGEHDVAAEAGIEASDLVRMGSKAFFDALDAALRGVSARGRAEAFEALLARLLAAEPEAGAEGSLLDALCHATGQAIYAGRHGPTRQGLARIAVLVASGRGVDARLAGEAEHVLAIDAWAAGRLEEAVRRLREACAHAERAGDARGASDHLGTLAVLLAELGASDEAEKTAQLTIARAQAVHVGTWNAQGMLAAGLVAARAGGRGDEARLLLDDAYAELSHAEEARLAGWAGATLAELDLEAGRPDAAEPRAREAVETLAHVPSLRAWATAIWSRALHRLDRPREALATARIAVDLARAHGVMFGDALPSLVLAEVLETAGDRFGAHATLERAGKRMRERSSAIGDESLRVAYLGTVDVARTLTLEAASAAIVAPAEIETP